MSNYEDLSFLVGATIVAVADGASLLDALGGVVLDDGRVILFTQPDYEDFDIEVVPLADFESRVADERRMQAILAKFIQRNSDAYYVPEAAAGQPNNQTRPRENVRSAGYGGWIERDDAEPWPTRDEDIAFVLRGCHDLESARCDADAAAKRTINYYKKYPKDSIIPR